VQIRLVLLRTGQPTCQGGRISQFIGEIEHSHYFPQLNSDRDPSLLSTSINQRHKHYAQQVTIPYEPIKAHYAF